MLRLPLCGNTWWMPWCVPATWKMHNTWRCGSWVKPWMLPPCYLLQPWHPRWSPKLQWRSLRNTTLWLWHFRIHFRHFRWTFCCCCWKRDDVKPILIIMQQLYDMIWYDIILGFSPSVGVKFVLRKNRKKLGESMKSWWQNVFRNYWPPIIRRSLRCCILRRWQPQLHPSFCHLYRVDLDLLDVETLGTKGSTVVFVHRFEKR